MANTLEYLLNLRDNFSSQMNRAAQTAIVSAGGIQSAGHKIIGSLSAMTDAIGGGFETLMGDYSKLGNLLSAIPGPIGEIGRVVGTALGQMMEDVEQQAEAFRKLSASTGASVEYLSAFTQAADDERVSAEAVNKSLEIFAKTLGNVTDITEGVSLSTAKIGDVLGDLGIAAQNADGSMRGMEEVLPEIADLFMTMPDGAQKTAIAVQLFGRRGMEMIPILNKGSRAINEMMQEAKEAGLVISNQTVKAIDSLKRSQDALGDSVQGLTTKIGSALIPVLADLAGGINGLMDGSYRLFMGYVDESGNVIAKTAEELYALEEAVDGITITYHQNNSVMKSTGETMASMVSRHQELSNASKFTADSTEWLAKKQAELEERTRDLTSAFTSSIDPLNDMAVAQAAFELATGQTTVEQLKQEMAAKALIKQYKDGNATLPELVAKMYQLRDGTLTADDALGIANTSAGEFRSQLNNVIGTAYAANPALMGATAATNTFRDSMNNAAGAAVTARARAGEYADMVRQVPDRNVKLTVDGYIDQSYYSANTKFYSPQDRRVTITYYGQYQGYDPGFACFSGDVLVATPAGPREIRMIQPGDSVLAYNHDQGEVVTGAVTDVLEHRRRPLYWLRFENGISMVTTREHPFYMPTKGWYQNAASLNTGDAVQLMDGSHTEVASAVASGWGLVWNIEVGEYHTYYANHVLVHNKCFAAGTLIDTPDGPRMIENIRPGDMVLAWNGFTVSERRVTQTFTNPSESICQVQLSGGGYVRCTPDHPFYAALLDRYVPAKSLQAGDWLITPGGVESIVLSVDWPQTVGAAERTTHNFTVDGLHNYFAGGVLVHNASEIITPGDMMRIGRANPTGGAAGSGAAARMAVAGPGGPVVNTPINILATHDPALLARRIADSQRQAAQAAALRASVGI